MECKKERQREQKIKNTKGQEDKRARIKHKNGKRRKIKAALTRYYSNSVKKSPNIQVIKTSHIKGHEKKKHANKKAQTGQRNKLNIEQNKSPTR